VRDASGEPAHRCEPLGAEHFLFEQGFFVQRGGRLTVGGEQLAEFVAIVVALCRRQRQRPAGPT
jgi:hypothetical protein